MFNLHPFKFFREVFSENGYGSFSRVAQGLIVISTLGWVWRIVLKTNSIPDLGGPSLFIATGAGGHYLVNKASGIIDSLKGNGTTPPAPNA